MIGPGSSDTIAARRGMTDFRGVNTGSRCAALVLALVLFGTACGKEETMDRPEGGDQPPAAEDQPRAAEDQPPAAEDQARAPVPEPDDVASIDAIVAALYDAISFEPGAEPDWDRLASLFHPDGRLIPPRGDESEVLPVLSVDEFIERSSAFLDESGIAEQGFHEREIGRTTERFGNIAHLFSAYESLHTRDDAEPFSRGINSIQLVWDRDRWWVLTILWDVERPENPIPEEYGG